MSVGPGDRRRRASSARGPSPTSFGRLGLTRARQPCSSGFSSMAGALGGLREALINGLRTRRVGRSSARRDERRAAALLTICGFKRLRQQIGALQPENLEEQRGLFDGEEADSEGEPDAHGARPSELHRAACRRRSLICIRSCVSGCRCVHGIAACHPCAHAILCPCHLYVHAISMSMPSLCPCHPCVHAIPVSMPFSMSCCHSVLRVRIPPVCMP